MRFGVVAGLLIGLVGVSAASAADAIAVPLSGTAAVLPVHGSETFDWNGFYTGIYGSARASGANTQGGLGIQVGVNTTFEFLLVGGEVSVEGLTGDAGSAAYGQILGRAGLVVTDDVLVYAAGGYGLELTAPAEQDLLAGGGLELAINDAVSLQAEYLRSFPTDGSVGDNRITFGANFHF